MVLTSKSALLHWPLGLVSRQRKEIFGGDGTMIETERTYAQGVTPRVCQVM